MRGCWGWRAEISASVLRSSSESSRREHDLYFAQTGRRARRSWGGTPCPLIRSFLPLDEPGGIDSVIVPLGVGTSTFAPWAASAIVTGTRTSRWFFCRVKGMRATWIVIRMSPGGAAVPGFALTAEADLFAVVDAGGDFHIDRFNLPSPRNGNLCFAPLASRW